MNGYLRDTSIALRAVVIPERLREPIRLAIEIGRAFLRLVRRLAIRVNGGRKHSRWNVDRALIAQAAVENLILLTEDSAIAQYASERFRVLR